MQRFGTIWDVTPETAHPRARHLLAQSIVWNYSDEDSPLGNDTGADTFAAYLSFRSAQPSGTIQNFIHEQLASRGVPDRDWELLDAHTLEELLNEDNGFAMLTRDDFIIGLAFAQLLLEGSLDPEVRHRAIVALRRQGTDVVLSFRGDAGHAERMHQLNEFRRILDLV